MAARLPVFLPRAIVIAFVALLGTAGLTYAAEQQIAPAPTPAAGQAPVQKRAVLVVPDLRRQAFVFAKGSLQDGGFAWRVVGSVHGYAANVVVAQSPAAGTRIFDTGAPVIKLTLSRNRKYPQNGAPEDISPYKATLVQAADGSGTASPTQAPATTTPAPAATTPAPAATTPAPAATTPAPAATTPAPAATPPAPVTATTAAQPETAAKPAVKPAAAKQQQYPQSRPAAFSVAGAPKEPLDEMPLVDRVNALGTWLGQHPKPTDANVRHWLYQNEWIVTGAKFGWWRGSEALKLLIAVDRRAGSVWGIGSKSEAAAARALTEVETKSR